MSELPEFYIADGGQRIAAPTYEALAQCQLVMASAETGQTGPTLVQPGEHFTTDAVPCHHWQPLNRAAAEKVDAWLQSLPLDGKNLTMEHITEAARMLAPRAGDPEFSHEIWSQQVMTLAAKLSEKRQAQLKPSVGFRPMSPNTPPMPFAAMGPGMPIEPGRAPAQHQPQNPANAAARARAGRVKPPMSGVSPAQGPQ